MFLDHAATTYCCWWWWSCTCSSQILISFYKLACCCCCFHCLIQSAPASFAHVGTCFGFVCLGSYVSNAHSVLFHQSACLLVIYVCLSACVCLSVCLSVCPSRTIGRQCTKSTMNKCDARRRHNNNNEGGSFFLSLSLSLSLFLAPFFWVSLFL